jgi:hypothetical protein
MFLELLRFVISLVFTAISFLFSYFGLVEWFVLTVLLLVSLVVGLLANALASTKDLLNQILLFIVMIPIFELMTSINLTFLFGFFQTQWISQSRRGLAVFIETK